LGNVVFQILRSSRLQTLCPKKSQNSHNLSGGHTKTESYGAVRADEDAGNGSAT
jgi:hypothetical protein